MIIHLFIVHTSVSRLAQQGPDMNEKKINRKDFFPTGALNCSIGNGGSDAVLQTAPEKAATPYTTILIFSSSAAQEITK